MTPPILVPDAGPLITLAYAGRLDLLLRPGWPVQVVDMVQFEVTRNQTSTSDAIASFIDKQHLSVVATEVYRRYQQRLVDAQAGNNPQPRKTGLGEMTIQEYMIRLGLEDLPAPAVNRQQAQVGLGPHPER